MKDAQAVTRQFITVPRVEPEKLLAIQTPQLSVLSAEKHINKIRLGHLKANRFAIRIREVEGTDVVKVRPIVDVLERDVIPRYYDRRAAWVDMMLSSIAMSQWRFSSDRMVQDYYRELYV